MTTSFPRSVGRTRDCSWACTPQFFAGSDSILTQVERPDGSLWLVAIPTDGGSSGDTVRVERAGYRFDVARVSPDGKYIFAHANPGADGSVWSLLMTRAGVPTDSLVIPREDNVSAMLDWSPKGQGLVFVVRDSLNPGLSLIVERGVDRRGRFTGDIRALLPATQIGAASISPGGLAYTSGPIETIVTAITRPDARSPRFETRQLAASTGELNAGLSPGRQPGLPDPTHSGWRSYRLPAVAGGLRRRA